MKATSALASATAAIGNFANRPASESTITTLDQDSSLVSRCMRGEETAWEDLVRLHTRRVYGLCYRFTGSGSEAQNLTQEVFLRVCRTLKTFHSVEGSFAT